MSEPIDQTDRNELLRIYLEDHVAGATAGAQRAGGWPRRRPSPRTVPALATFATDVSTDRDALLALMEVAGVEPSRLKSALASVGEKLGALKPNGRLTERSPLSTLVELEAMQMAVRGKRSLWETLLVAMPATTGIDIGGLITRADDQLALLSDVHARRTQSIFAVQPS